MLELSAPVIAIVGPTASGKSDLALELACVLPGARGASGAGEIVSADALQLYRGSRGSRAVMVVECDQEVPAEALQWLRHLDGIEKVTYYSLEG